jgi:hypothetical protein
VRRVALGVVMGMLVWSCTAGAESTTTSQASTPPSSTAGSTVSPTESVPPAPPSSASPPLPMTGPTVSTVPSSSHHARVFCGDLSAAGYRFSEALAYWVAEGTPDRMDADRDGIPCETVYAAEEIQSVLRFDERPGADRLPEGLLCREVAAHGYGFAEALAYWVRDGTPGRMDADRNGIPCETVYDTWEVFRVTSLLDAGWQASLLELPASYGACCGEPDRAPPSPEFPDAGQPLRDGVYAALVSPFADLRSQLEVEVRRWVDCTSQPDQCLPPIEKGEVFVDESQSALVTLPLDETLTVIVQGVPTGPDSVPTQVTGDGGALARLSRYVELACRPGSDPDTQVGIIVIDGFLGPESVCRGPLGLFLNLGYWDHGYWGWTPHFEIRNGEPVLWLWWGALEGAG